MSTPKVVVVGSANADLVLGSDVVTTPGARAHDDGTRVVGAPPGAPRSPTPPAPSWRNDEEARHLGRARPLGHTHHAVVGDCGLPRPDGVVAVDRVGVARETRAAEAATAQLFVRTGEATTYANAILRCGVPF